ncbi:MAG: MerR family transcriptional regulator [Actinobacteria bacterium]|nr:MerR family transcriptional regulator [Actinomycetota bacterium]MBE3094886.1 MerR family transcriptional regulator [Actinomycetota bacterium]
MFNNSDKSYPIELVAEFLGVNSRTLYYYERFKLVCPIRRGRKRYYSRLDINWLEYVRELMYEQGMNLRSIIVLIKRRDNVILTKCPDDVVDSFKNYLMRLRED